MAFTYGKNVGPRTTANKMPIKPMRAPGIAVAQARVPVQAKVPAAPMRASQPVATAGMPVAGTPPVGGMMGRAAMRKR
jgi:hypothetical protein